MCLCSQPSRALGSKHPVLDTGPALQLRLPVKNEGEELFPAAFSHTGTERNSAETPLLAAEASGVKETLPKELVTLLKAAKRAAEVTARDTWVCRGGGAGVCIAASTRATIRKATQDR